MALYHIRHTTTYDYSAAVTSSHQAARIEPLNGAGQVVHNFSFKVTPEPRDIIRRIDYYGNPVRFFSLNEPHTQLVVEGQSRVTVKPRATLLAQLSPTCGEVRQSLARPRPDQLEAVSFTYASPRIPIMTEAREFAQNSLADNRPMLEAALALSRKIHQHFAFKAGITDAYSPISTFLKARKGVCQDFAHFMIACLRACELPAAYMSGYIRTIPPPGRPRLVGADASHAWVAVYIPPLGWVEIDPTNNLLAGEDHITVARGRDYGDVSLLRGTILGGGSQVIKVAVNVEPVG